MSTNLVVVIIFAIAGGFLPVLFWLWLWEHEDKNPEPHFLVFLAFFGGIIATFVAIPLEKFVSMATQNQFMVFLLWATIEESLKFGAAYFLCLRRAENDEPIDGLMYMVVVALGFAAMENALFLFSPLYQGLIHQAFVVGNARFIGATLLHVVASSSIGIALAFSFYKPRLVRLNYIIYGLLCAIGLHTLFNLSIMNTNGQTEALPLYGVWIGIIILIMITQKIKHITNKSLKN